MVAGRSQNLVIGDMAELGSESAEWHRIAGRTVARMQIDQLAAIGRYAPDVVRGAIEQGMTHRQVAECESLDSLLAVLDSWSAGGRRRPGQRLALHADGAGERVAHPEIPNQQGNNWPE